MNQLKYFKSYNFLFIILPALFLLSSCGTNETTEPNDRTDLVVIDGLKQFGDLERYPIIFPHDLHTKALTDKDDLCGTCHQTNDKGVLSQKYLRLVEDTKEDVMNLYHNNCLVCHNERIENDQKSGPVTCGDCHTKELKYISKREPMGFDLSLHYRHIEVNHEKCELCHHTYDEVKKELVYVKGAEKSCRNCHQAQKEENRISFRSAVHQNCVGCHKSMGEENAGPIQCEGCHDVELQRTIVRLEEIPRLNQNQPNMVLLAASKEDLESSKMNVVPFDHKAHESYNTTCRVCHHEDLIACKDCHTLMGNNEKSDVKLQRSMHAMNSDHSCIGCHDRKKAETECAGCHSLMEQGRLSESACQKCHVGPPPQKLPTQRKSTAISTMNKQVSRLTFSENDIPDSVTIKLLQEEYEPVTFPHRKIVKTLQKHIQKSQVATFFHGHEDVVCQGCHHHSPVSQKPPLCENCHGKAFQESKVPMPGILAAYHRQCIFCHEKMEIEAPTTDCAGCHQKADVKKIASK